MILVIGDANDITTNITMEWIQHYTSDVKRINFSDFTPLNGLRLSNDTNSVVLADIDMSTVHKIWHRRGSIRFLSKKLRANTSLYPYLKKEEDSLLKSLEDMLGDHSEYIGSYHKEVENYKIDYLITAKECGISIPDTLITTAKKELKLFFNTYDQIITKDIRYGIKIHQAEQSLYSAGTFIVNQEMIGSMNNTFAPTLVQEKIEKKYEIRVFFFKERLYPMAILSQNDKQTTIDYRNYNRKRPNRNVPVLLPDTIEKKVLDFIGKCGLSTGSIDMIVDTFDNYIFLEVNPQGQLDWVSKNCNYHIEKEIAEYLIS
ncbi:hypothetical protein [Aquimarina sp. SS2-1]|uniref:hypothetical protein n=1 Tax=Aquimarina besae TaxID=3342247 RepID=UPI00366CC0D9